MNKQIETTGKILQFIPHAGMNHDAFFCTGESHGYSQINEVWQDILGNTGTMSIDEFDDTGISDAALAWEAYAGDSPCLLKDRKRFVAWLSGFGIDGEAVASLMSWEKIAGRIRE